MSDEVVDLTLSDDEQEAPSGGENRAVSLNEAKNLHVDDGNVLENGPGNESMAAEEPKMEAEKDDHGE